jgi:transcriptional regulator with XRE-family HTH domain
MAKIQGSQTKAFGRAVREYRAKAGLSQEELAHRSGLHRTYVGSVERGERNISLKNIFALAASLATSPAQLLTVAEKLSNYRRDSRTRS